MATGLKVHINPLGMLQVQVLGWDTTIVQNYYNTILFRNRSVTTKKAKILHRAVKSAILNVSAPFRMDLWNDLDLDTSVQTSLIF